MTDEYANQPPITDWKFIEELKSPLHHKILWRRGKKKNNEVDLRHGVTLDFGFPDPDGKLDTAYADFRRFLAAGEIAVPGKYQIITGITSTSVFEEYLLDIGPDVCRLLAHDTEGIRRALVCLEDRITSTGGPFIAMEKINRRPFIKTRISRCFFGPIKRPPLNRDELLDDVNYYPDEYLNRLVHESINGLWLSIEFRDLCPSRFFPEHGKDAARRLAKLRRTVDQCLRYGIKTYIFCNEPLGFGSSYYTLPAAELNGHPELAGHREGDWTYFCTSSPEGRQYLEDCTYYLFSKVPNLGGMICITHGERPTNCYSYPNNFIHNNCPRCSQRTPWEVYHDTLSAMVKGVKRAAPEAEFISWLYASSLTDDQDSSAEKKEEIMRKIAAHTPPEVTMQMNFESNGRVRQLDRVFMAYDYWLAWPGPSRLFADSAAAAINAGARASAKIQVGNSHENATIPFMPVPGNLYRKYKAMKKLGVSTVMQCWYFGNYPGLMNKAAGELSFEPFPEKESTFLEALARIDWADDYRRIARAWQYFRTGYSHFPITLSFTWFGPLHCSIVWPLHLFPVDLPIAPSWEFGYPDSGDRIGECIGFKYTFEEILRLLGQMDDCWQKGVAIFDYLAGKYNRNPERQRDLNLGKAIGLQIRSARNAFSFYDLREKLPFLPQAEQFVKWEEMAAIVREEITNSLQMCELCLNDPRLGFHSEAEGYKFFPAKLEWRVRLLEELLSRDFPRVYTAIADGTPLFPEYTGMTVVENSYRCAGSRPEAATAWWNDGTGSWRAWNSDKQFHLELKWQADDVVPGFIGIAVEPRRLWPVVRFEIATDGEKQGHLSVMEGVAEWDTNIRKTGKYSVATFTLPFAAIPWYDGTRPLRVNLYRTDIDHQCRSAWIMPHPLKARLLFGTQNSKDLGWLYPAPEPPAPTMRPFRNNHRNVAAKNHSLGVTVE